MSEARFNFVLSGRARESKIAASAFYSVAVGSYSLKHTQQVTTTYAVLYCAADITVPSIFIIKNVSKGATIYVSFDKGVTNHCPLEYGEFIYVVIPYVLWNGVNIRVKASSIGLVEYIILDNIGVL